MTNSSRVQTIIGSAWARWSIVIMAVALLVYLSAPASGIAADSNDDSYSPDQFADDCEMGGGTVSVSTETSEDPDGGTSIYSFYSCDLGGGYGLTCMDSFTVGSGGFIQDDNGTGNVDGDCTEWKENAAPGEAGPAGAPEIRGAGGELAPNEVTPVKRRRRQRSAVAVQPLPVAPASPMAPAGDRGTGQSRAKGNLGSLGGVSRGLAPLVPVMPAPLPQTGCPGRDPAAQSIEFSPVPVLLGDFGAGSPYKRRVSIVGVVKNLGQGDYVSSPGKQSARLYEDGRLVASTDFASLPAGATVRVKYQRQWNTRSTSEGEFPPTYRLVILYDPDITKDSNPDNDDCNSANNVTERSGAAINEMFR